MGWSKVTMWAQKDDNDMTQDWLRSQTNTQNLNSPKRDEILEANTQNTKQSPTQTCKKHIWHNRDNELELTQYFDTDFHQIQQIKKYNRDENKNKTYVEDVKISMYKNKNTAKFEPIIVELNHNREKHVKLWNKTL